MNRTVVWKGEISTRLGVWKPAEIVIEGNFSVFKHTVEAIGKLPGKPLMCIYQPSDDPCIRRRFHAADCTAFALRPEPAMEIWVRVDWGKSQ